MEAMMKIAIFGVGAMGCLFGARLSPHADVTLIGRWPEQLAALRAGPLRVVAADGQTSEVQIAVEVADALDGPSLHGACDAALIMVKSAQTRRAAEGAAKVLKADGIALTLQNGIGNLEIIAEVVLQHPDRPVNPAPPAWRVPGSGGTGRGSRAHRARHRLRARAGAGRLLGRQGAVGRGRGRA